MTPESKSFYEAGRKTRQAGILLPSIQVGMPHAEIETLLGKPSDVRTVGDREYWSYTLFYSQALRATANMLRPFISEHRAGTRIWDGVTHRRADQSRRVDPYALAWWSILKTMADLIERQNCELTKEQRDYVEHQRFGGTGSLLDFSLDVSSYGREGEQADKKLVKAGESLSVILKSIRIR
jgi:hypothetical protein